jgi:hypothetical protein
MPPRVSRLASMDCLSERAVELRAQTQKVLFFSLRSSAPSDGPLTRRGVASPLLPGRCTGTALLHFATNSVHLSAFFASI